MLIGLVGGFFDGVVGGGGLIIFPFLVFLGLPAQLAITTDRLGIIGENIGSLPRYWKEKKIVWKYLPILAAITIISSFIGANMLVNVDNDFLTIILGIVILVVLPLIYFKKDIGLISKKISKKHENIGYFIFFILMILASFFGVGIGVLTTYTFVLIFGMTFLESIGTGKVMWIILSIISFIIFAINGIVDYVYGIILFLGMIFGGYIGAHTAIKKGNSWVRYVFFILVLVSAIKLLFF